MFYSLLPTASSMIAQEGIAVAGGFLLAHTADIQQFIGAQWLLLHHFPQGGIAEHHKGRDILLSGQPLALSIEGIQQLFVKLAQLACHRLCAARLLGQAAGIIRRAAGGNTPPAAALPALRPDSRSSCRISLVQLRRSNAAEIPADSPAWWNKMSCT